MSEVWVDAEWVREHLDRSGRTQRSLAKALNLDPSGVSRILEGDRKIRAEEIPLLLDFFGATEGTMPTDRPVRDLAVNETPRMDGERKRRVPGPKPRLKGASDLPVYGGLSHHADLEFEARDVKPAEYRMRPPQLAGVMGAYALFVPDESLAPRYRAGEVLYVHPGKPPIAGTDVVVRVRHNAVRLIIARILALDEGALLLIHPGTRNTHEDPRRALRLKPEEVGQVGRVLSTSAD